MLLLGTGVGRHLNKSLKYDVTTEVGIYNRKQESRKTENKVSTKKAIKKTRKKERKHALDQESVQERKKTFFIGRVLVFFLNSHL